MTDKELIDALRSYARSYTDGNPYNLNPGVALMAANRMEQLIAIIENNPSRKHEEGFNIGDRVWIPDCMYDEWFVANKEGYIIHSVRIYMDSECNEFKRYTLLNNNSFLEHPQRLCFSSYEECKEWCDKKNKWQ